MDISILGKHQQSQLIQLTSSSISTEKKDHETPTLKNNEIILQAWQAKCQSPYPCFKTADR